MKRLLQYSLLLCAVAAAPVIAAEAGMCKSICSSEKRECRASAMHDSHADGLEPIAQMERGRDAKALSKLQSTPLEARRDRQGEFRKRKQERDSACESRALACSRTCATPAPQTASSMLLKPQSQR